MENLSFKNNYFVNNGIATHVYRNSGTITLKGCANAELATVMII
jgi:hypothetical protein